MVNQHVSGPTTLRECNIEWPEILEEASTWYGCEGPFYESRFCTAIRRAMGLRDRTSWAPYRNAFKEGNLAKLETFYRLKVEPIVQQLNEAEVLARQKARALKNQLWEGKLAKAEALLVAEAAALQSRRYQWLPGNSCGNPWDRAFEEGYRSTGPHHPGR